MKPVQTVLNSIKTRKRLTVINEACLRLASAHGQRLLKAFSLEVKLPDGTTVGVLTVSNQVITSDSVAFVQLAIEAAKANPYYEGLRFAVRELKPTCAKEPAKDRPTALPMPNPAP